MSEVLLTQLYLLGRDGDRASGYKQQSVAVDMNTACVAQGPGCVRQLLPMFSISRIPHVITIAVRRHFLRMVSNPPVPAQHPKLAVPHRSIVIGACRPARLPLRQMTDLFATVCRRPHIIVVEARLESWLLREVVS